MLLGSLLTFLTLSSSVFAVPASLPKNARAVAPAPGASVKQTTRDEILNRQKRKMHRPARRAVVSRAAGPGQIGFFEKDSESSGVQLSSLTPVLSYTITANQNELDALQSCIGNTPTAVLSVALSYSNSNDIYTCTYYSGYNAATVPDSDNGLLSYYRHIGA